MKSPTVCKSPFRSLPSPHKTCFYFELPWDKPRSGVGADYGSGSTKPLVSVAVPSWQLCPPPPAVHSDSRNIYRYLAFVAKSLVGWFFPRKLQRQLQPYWKGTVIKSENVPFFIKAKKLFKTSFLLAVCLSMFPRHVSSDAKSNKKQCLVTLFVPYPPPKRKCDIQVHKKHLSEPR